MRRWSSRTRSAFRHLNEPLPGPPAMWWTTPCLSMIGQGVFYRNQRMGVQAGGGAPAQRGRAAAPRGGARVGDPQRTCAPEGGGGRHRTGPEDGTLRPGRERPSTAAAEIPRLCQELQLDQLERDFLREHSVLCQQVMLKYACLRAHWRQHTLGYACRVLRRAALRHNAAKHRRPIRRCATDSASARKWCRHPPAESAAPRASRGVHAEVVSERRALRRRARSQTDAEASGVRRSTNLERWLAAPKRAQSGMVE